MIKLTLIDASRQPINQANDEGHCPRMEARLAATKAQGGFDREFLVFQKPTQGTSLRIYPNLL
jgi:hypothetical protein